MNVRDRILEEATRQFFQYGIRNVTMDEIANQLGISKRTVYETFKDKSELIKDSLKALSERHEDNNNSIIAKSSNVIEAIFIFLEEGIRAMNSVNPVFLFDLKKFYPVIWKHLHEENLVKSYNLSYTLLRKGVNEGLFRKDINLEIVAKLFHEQMNLIADENVFPRDKYSHTQVFQNMLINFTRGISTQKGIQIIDEILEKNTIV